MRSLLKPLAFALAFAFPLHVTAQTEEAPIKAPPAGLFLSFNKALQSGDFEQAAHFGEKLILQSTEGGDNPLASLYIETLVASGQVEKALNATSVLNKTQEESIPIISLLTFHALKTKNYTEVLTQTARLPSMPPLRPDLIKLALIRAWVAAENGDKKTALDAFSPLEKAGGHKNFFLLQKARLLTKLGELEEAKKTYLSFQKSYSGKKASAEEAVVLLINTLSFLGEYGFEDEKEKLLTQLPKNHPLRKKPELAKKDWAKIDSLEEEVSTVSFSLTQRFRQSVPLINSQYWVSLSLYLTPDLEDAYFFKADLLNEEDRPDLAAQVLSPLLNSSVPQTRIRAASEQAQTYLLNTQSAKAIETLETALKADPESPLIQEGLARLYSHEKRYPEAISLFEKALNSKEIQNSTPALAQLHYSLGVSYYENKNWEKAESHFLKALELNPKSPSILNFLAYSWLERGTKIDEAEKMLRQAVETAPKDGAILDSLGWLLYRQGKLEEALPWLEKSILAIPDDPTINDHLGDLYWRLDRKREARFQWKRSLFFKPEAEQITLIEEKLKTGWRKELDPGWLDIPQDEVSPSASPTLDQRDEASEL